MSERIKFTSATRKSVYAKYNGHCAICGRPVKYNDMTIDHIIPLSSGGTNEKDNLELSCLRCNLMKSNMDFPEFFRSISEILVHNWKEIVKFHVKHMFLKGGVV